MKATYKNSGVDIKKADKFIRDIIPLAKQTRRLEVLDSIGSFGGFFSFLKNKFDNPVLVSSSDGVGTKIKIAIANNIHDTVGIDLVAMNVNDILCSGAEPLFFLDYIACSRLDPATLKSIIQGIVEGCKQAGCALLGGETAEMPSMYKKGDYDLAGFCVGVVEKGKILNSKKVKIKDLAIGIASSGLHSNGFSLVRKVLSKKDQSALRKELLTPTRIYSKAVLKLLKEYNKNSAFKIKAIAHITGGAFYSKAARIVPDGETLVLDKGSWPVPKIFKLIKAKAKISDREMFNTFNMGIGLILIVKKNSAGPILKRLNSLGLRSWLIGEIVKGKKKIVIN